ncbi:MAG: 7TM domain-containing protein [Bacteroidota bacterium]
MTLIKSRFHVVVFGLMLVPMLLIGWKIKQGYFSAQQLLPQTAYQVQYDFYLDSLQGKDALFVKTYVPSSDAHQEISEVRMGGGDFSVAHQLSPMGKQVVWESSALPDSAYHLSYTFTYRGEATAYTLDSGLVIGEALPTSASQWLEGSPYIQAADERILAKQEELQGGSYSLPHTLQQFFAYTASLRPLQTSELTDAVTALEQGAASCNGKSRLFVALCQAAGIPARVVGGIILQDVEKRTSHLWAEAYVAGNWVPFDPLNGHFAFLPENYLRLYRGDDFLIRRSASMGFDYQYTIKSQQYVPITQQADLTLWALPVQGEIPLSLLKLVLLLPICVLVVALFKNVVGIKTFGVFLPAIIAMAMADVGFVTGALIYCSLIAIVGLLHYPLEKWGLLYTPRLVALLVAMVGTLLGLTYLGVSTQNGILGAMVFFPIIVLTIAAERFARTIVEDGYREAIQLQGQTLVVTFCCYLVYTADFLPGFFLTFPETYLLILGLVLLLGRWIGLRVTEYRRFNWVVS